VFDVGAFLVVFLQRKVQWRFPCTTFHFPLPASRRTSRTSRTSRFRDGRCEGCECSSLCFLHYSLLVLLYFPQSLGRDFACPQSSSLSLFQLISSMAASKPECMAKCSWPCSSNSLLHRCCCFQLSPSAKEVKRRVCRCCVTVSWNIRLLFATNIGG
jgi:hypothetical protein